MYWDGGISARQNGFRRLTQTIDELSDDVDAGGSEEDKIARKLFIRVIGAQYNARKPTGITANLTRKDLEAAMGDRAFDCIQHACGWVVFDGPRYRAEIENARVQETLVRVGPAASL